MKKFLALLTIIFVSLSSVALAKKPIRIARLPIIIQRNILDAETAALLEVKIARAVNIPMNKTLNIAEYISTRESKQALGTIWQRMRTQNRNAKLSDAVRILADEIDADLVVCPFLQHYEQRISPVSFSFETHLSSYVTAEMIVYDKSTGNLIEKRVSRRFSDNYNRFGTASYLAGECIDQLIQDTGLRELIRSKKG